MYVNMCKKFFVCMYFLNVYMYTCIYRVFRLLGGYFRANMFVSLFFDYAGQSRYHLLGGVVWKKCLFLKGKAWNIDFVCKLTRN